MRKFGFFTLLSIIIVVLVAGCGSNDADTGEEDVEVVKIGTILPLTGGEAPLGEIGREAREMAVEEINEAGGIESLDGAKLELIFGDSEGDPSVAVSETERLLTSENVDLLNGAYQSGVTLPASAVAQTHEKVWFAPVPSEDTITEQGHDYVFRLADTSSMRVQTQIDFMNYLEEENDEEINTVALVYENTAWGQGVGDMWKDMLPDQGFEVIADEPYDASTADLTPVASKIKSADPDAVLLVSYVSDATLLANAFDEQKVEPKLFLGTSGGYADPEYIDNTGSSTLGFFDVSAWESDVDRPFSQETNEKFIENYGHPMNGEVVKAYTGMYVIKDVLERAGSTDSEAIQGAFAETDITEGPTEIYTENVHFDETGTLPDPSLIVVQFKEIDGEVERVTVWPEDVARKQDDDDSYPIDFPFNK